MESYPIPRSAATLCLGDNIVDVWREDHEPPRLALSGILSLSLSLSLSLILSFSRSLALSLSLSCSLSRSLSP